jgi:outer membrane murein-binding lipoprotein Lpp
MVRKILIVVFALVVLGGCAATQEISQISTPAPNIVCIVKHVAVKEGVLVALQEEFQANGMTPTVVDGAYELKHNLWQPTWSPEQVQSCDALCFYVANWSWDLATYMSFANIWMTDAAGSAKIAQATYDATRVPGPSKFINAEAKIKELTSQMLAGKRSHQ